VNWRRFNLIEKAVVGFFHAAILAATGFGLIEWTQTQVVLLHALLLAASGLIGAIISPLKFPPPGPDEVAE